MILKIKKWCEEIIVAVILCIIIESLIPNEKNKKYIKVIIGIYIIYVTLNPIFSLLNYDFDFEKFVNQSGNYEEVSNSFDDNIKDIYVLGIENNIKEDINKMGYDIGNIEIFVDTNYENIEKIEISDLNLLDIKVEEKNLANYEIIKDWISENYNIKKDKIVFK